MNMNGEIQINGIIKKISDFQGIKRKISCMAENGVKHIALKLPSGFAVSSHFINFLFGIIHKFDTKISIYTKDTELYDMLCDLGLGDAFNIINHN